MKRLSLLTLGTVALSLAASRVAWAEDLLPGQVDFGNFSAPQNGGDFVEVNVPSSLITLGASLIEKEDADTAKLLRGLKMVQVHVIGMDDGNRAEILKRVQKVRKDLAGRGWERIVTAQQKDQDVGVYLKITDKEGIQGLAAVVVDGREHAVFVNVVGDIKPEQIALLGEKLHIDPLEKIGHAAEKHEKAAPAAEPKAEQ
jgi:hypothetical protein